MVCSLVPYIILVCFAERLLKGDVKYFPYTRMSTRKLGGGNARDYQNLYNIIMYACISQVSHCIAFPYLRSTIIVVPVYAI